MSPSLSTPHWSILSIVYIGLLSFTGGFHLPFAQGSRECIARMDNSNPEEAYCMPEESFSFFLLRHGQTNFNLEGRIQGTLDTSVLTDKGKEQAQAVGKYLANEEPFDKIFVSPMTRAQQTLAIVVEELQAAGKPIPDIETIDEIREIELFEWQGQLKSDLRVKYPNEIQAWSTQPTEFVLGGRQPVVELFERASVAWSKIRDSLANDAVMVGKSQPSILMVAHGAVNQALIGTAFGFGPQVYRKYPFPNCGMAEILWDLKGSNQASMFRWQYPSSGPLMSSQELEELPFTDTIVH
mmetsp:Transcript_30512/g.40309  ORF Transcript_30512/g.40309 Transcript_30512/m.40309 type:complete len:296 (+) Transcript_30512:36-923(+)